MQTDVTASRATVPNSAAFRTWVQDGIAELGMSARSVGRALDLGKNTLGQFLAQPGRSLHLDTAARIEAYLRTQAALMGKTLPAFDGGTHG